MRIGIHGKAVVGNFARLSAQIIPRLALQELSLRALNSFEAGEVFVSEPTAKLMDDDATVEVGAFEPATEGEATLYRVV